jgi:hypothetical protein
MLKVVREGRRTMNKREINRVSVERVEFDQSEAENERDDRDAKPTVRSTVRATSCRNGWKGSGSNIFAGHL